MPDFITCAKLVYTEMDRSTGEKRITYALEQGEYYIDAFKLIDLEMGAWLCGSFTVVAE